jgi:hypothetical protein
MPPFNLTVQHGRTLEEAARSLERAVQQVSQQFGALVRRVEWSGDRHRVKLDGIGFWVEMWVDAQAVHAQGDIPVLGRLLGQPVDTGLKRIVEKTFRKKLP